LTATASVETLPLHGRETTVEDQGGANGEAGLIRAQVAHRGAQLRCAEEPSDGDGRQNLFLGQPGRGEEALEHAVVDVGGEEGEGIDTDRFLRDLDGGRLGQSVNTPLVAA
jgi:hypothetical protein